MPFFRASDIIESARKGGTTANSAEMAVYSGGEDVTHNYEITTNWGTLTILTQDKEIDDETDMLIGRIYSDRSGLYYLRQNSYGNYTGQGMKAAPVYTEMLEGSYSYTYLPAWLMEEQGLETVSLQLRDMVLYMLPYNIAMNQGNYTVPGGDTGVGEGTSSYSLVCFQAPTSYVQLRQLSQYLGQRSAEEQRYRSFVYNNYLTVDWQTRAFMQEIINQRDFRADDPLIIEKVARYIQHAARYNLYYDKALDEEENVVISFLQDYREGKCVHYAMSATMLYRALGIPARYTEGFAVETAAGEWTDIRTPGHAWVEVYLDGVGWVPVEVTGANAGSGDHEETRQKPELELVPAFQYKVYDGSPLLAKNELVLTPTLQALLEQGYRYTVSVSGQQTNLGTGESRIDSFILRNFEGEDVTDQFELKIYPGTLEVREKFVRVYLYEKHLVYNGQPLALAETDYELLDGNASYQLMMQLRLEASEGISVDVLNACRGRMLTARVLRNGQDVSDTVGILFDGKGTENTRTYCPLRIDPLEIVVSSQSAVHVDDGRPFSCDVVWVSKGTLAPGHTLIANTITILEGVGESINAIDGHNVQILDADGNDVTHNYKIQLDEGTLIVLDPEEI